MHYLMPKQGVLSMHCSANEGSGGDVSLFFGLSGTGKTTLSADPRRRLIGDDEHCWTDRGVFNIEGGCYAKCINLSAEKEPEIFGPFASARCWKTSWPIPHTRVVDYNDAHLTENTRACYPIEFIPNAKVPCLGGHPAEHHLPHLRRLRRVAAGGQADAGPGDVPLHQRLHGQGRRHRDGREGAGGDVLGLLRRGVPRVAPDEVRPDAGRQDARAQARGLAGQHRLDGRPVRRGQPHQAGPHAGDHRRDPRRAARGRRPTQTEPVFGLAVPTSCPGVPAELLMPRNTWSKPGAYDTKALHLAKLFQANFAQYADQATAEVQAAGPNLAAD